MPPTKPISGGCLCGSIRYEINFSDPSASPPKTHTCQCSQCRKRHGALLTHWIDTTPSRVTWSSSTRPTSQTTSPSELHSFAEYSASAGKYRGFCTTCGSPLTWRSEETPGELEIATGSVDGDLLAGEVGRVLGRASEGHFWCGNAVEGVTDLQGGRRFRGGSGSEVVGGGV